MRSNTYVLLVLAATQITGWGTVPAIALRMNLINALAPPVLAALLTRIGAQAVFAVLAGSSIAAFSALVVLNRLRKHSVLAGQ